MELQQFQGLALRTESRIQGIQLNRTNLITLLKLVVEVTEILDAIKKAAFYNKTAKLEDNFGARLFTISKLVETLIWSNSGHGPLGTVLDKDETISNVDPRVFHGILGIVTESGELASALLKSVEDPNHVVDAVNIQEEMSDIAWYEAILHDTLNLDWGQGLENVIEKLRIRYPDKYSDEAADNRDLDAERKALERGNEQLNYEESLDDDTRAVRASLALVYCGDSATHGLEVTGANPEHVADVFNRLPVIKAEDIIGVQPMVANVGEVFPMQPVPTVSEENGRRVFYVEVPEGTSAEEMQSILDNLKNRVLYADSYKTPGKK